MALLLKPWVENLTIQTKDLEIKPIRLADPFAWAQRALIRKVEEQYNNGQPVRVIVLKGRQLGISTITEAMLFNWAFIHPGTRSLVIAHETEAAKNLFNMTKLMWEEWPLRPYYTEHHNNVRSLGWQETRSSMTIATARNAGSGRSFTRHAVHCSECAFWDPDKAEELMLGLNQSVPRAHGTIVIIESTANGVGGWYHDEWIRAVEGESQYTPMFFPWFKHYEYAINNTTLKQHDLTKPERDIQSEFSLVLPQLAWRRWAIDNQCNGDEKQFMQEYPCTPDEAFLTTGNNIFPGQKVNEAFKPHEPSVTGRLVYDGPSVQFIPDVDGPLTIWTMPAERKEWGKYVVAGDPSRTTYGDPACIQVLNRRTLEQVAVWHGHIDPIPFAHELMKLGYFYNTALVNTEINGPGYSTIGVLIQAEYPDIWRFRWADKSQGKLSQAYGWEMSWKRKNWAVGFVINLLAKNRLEIHDRKTYDQMMVYAQLDFMEMGAPGKGHDDAVSAYLIAVCSTMTEYPLSYPQDTDTTPGATDFFDQPPWEAFG